MDSKKKANCTVCILGLGPQGLALLRAYSEEGFNCIAIGMKDDVGIYSRYGKVIIIKQLYELLKLIENNLFGVEIIHISGDIILNYLIDNYPKIFYKYNTYPKIESALIFRDKIETLKLAHELEIAYPKTWKFNKNDSLVNIKLPIIIKWNRTLRFPTFKTITLRQLEDMPKYINDECGDNLIVQKYVNGESVSYAGFWNNGCEIAGLVVHQKRQFPMGLTSFAKILDGDLASTVKELSKKLLSKTNFSGFCEVEYKFDNKKNKVYLIEVNPRACGWIKILIYNFKQKVLNNEFSNITDMKRRICWVNLARDFNAVRFLLRTSPNKLKFRELLNDYLSNPVMDIFDIYDIKPFILQLRKIIKAKQ